MPQRHLGFTLLELLFVLVIVGLGSVLAVSNISQLAGRAGETGWVDNVVRELKRARVKAVLSGLPSQVDIQYETGTLIPGQRDQLPVQLPERYAFTALPEGTEAKQQSIIFYPDGSATATAFRLNTPTSRAYEIRVNGLNGHVAAHAPGQG